MTRYLVAIDPGKKTGMAIFIIDDPKNPHLTGTWELGFEGFQDAFASFLKNHLPLHEVEVVIEEFIISPETAKLTSAPWSLKHIGVVEYLSRVHGAKFAVQSRNIKKFTPNERLKALELWHRGGGGHALDALRHAVGYLVAKYNWHPDALLDSDDS